MPIKFLNDVAVDTSVLYVDTVNDRVGIGTASPASKLQVNTGTDINAQIGLDSFGSFKLGDISNNYTGRGIYYDGTAGSEDLDILTNTFNIAGGSGEGIKVVSSTDVQLSSPTGVVITINGTSSNVGIGTTSPAEKLAVSGSIRIPRTEEFYWTDGSINGNARAVIFSTDNEFGGDYNGIGFSVGANGRTAPSMYIRGTGNVGIGTTSPAYLLDVNEDDNVLAFRVTGGGGGAPIASFVRDVGATGSSVNINAQSNFPQIQFANTGNTFSIGGDTSGNFKISDNTAIGTNDRITIDNTGNVGIGTTSPQEKLHVYNGSAYITPIAYAANQNDWVIRAGAYNNTSFDQGLKLKSTSGGVSYMAFETAHSGGETMVLRSGNVGIGTDSPSQKLHVAGNLRVTGAYYDSNNSPGTANQVLVSTVTGTDWIDGSAMLGVPGGSGTLNTVAMWTPDGDTLGDSPITISGNNATFAGNVTAANLFLGSSSVRISPGGSGEIGLNYNTGATGSLVWYAGGTASKFSVTNAGNATFAGSIYAASTIGNLTGGSLGQQMERGSASVTTLRFDADSWRVYAGGSGSSGEILRVIETGNVGIGTTSPGAKLDINNDAQIDTYAAGTTVAHNAGYIRLLADAKTGWAPGDELGKIEFYSKDTSGIGARNAASIRAVNNQGNGSSTTTFEGELAFYTSLFNTTEAEAVRIDSAGNVGIGTTSPSQKLEVSTPYENVSKFVGNTDDGTGYVGAVVEIESNNDARGRGVYLTHRLSTDTTDSEWYAGVPYGGNGYSIGNAAYGTSINSDTGPAHKDQSKLFILENGNVGIGTTNPSAKLHVNSSDATTVQRIQGATNSALEFYNSSTKTGAILVNSTQFLIAADNSNYLNINTGGSERMRITSAGNVGIGTTSPLSQLTVQSSNTTAYDATIDDGQDSEGATIMAFNADNTTTNSFAQILFRNRSSSVGVSRIVSLSTAAASTALAFVTEHSNTKAEKMRITSTGNVGIGTDSPDSKLDVGGDLLISSNKTNATNKTNRIKGQHYTNAEEPVTFMFSNNFSSTNILHIGGGSTIENAVTSIGFYTGATNTTTQGSLAMYIDNDQNVGIGTTSPDAKLNIDTSSAWGTAVTEALTIDNTGSAGNVNTEHSLGRIRWRTNGTIGASIDAIRDTPGAGNNVDIAFSTNTGGSGTSAAERMRINYNGNVGIGTTSPSVALQVGDGTVDDAVRSYFNDGNYTEMRGYGLQFSRGFSYIRPTTDNTKSLYIGTSTAQWNTLSMDASTTTFNANGSEKMRITSAGAVGIGTTTTSGVSNAKLYVNGGIHLPSNRDISGALGLSPHIGTGDFILYSGNPGSGSEKFRITNAGDVGISETSPVAKLDVSGAGNFSGGTVVSGIDSHTDVGISIAKGSYVKSNDGNYLRTLIGQQSGGAIDIGQQGTSLISDINLKPGSSGNIDFFGSGSVDMRVASSGNVGIGTTSPSEKLHVVGSALIEGSSTELKVKGSGSYDTANITMGNAAKADSFSIDTRNDPGDNKTTLSFDSYQTTGTSTITLGDNYVNLSTASSTRLVINSSGNVGIGTTSPGEKLTVKGTDQYVAAEQTNYVWGGTNTIGVRMGTDAIGGLLDFRRWTGTAATHGTVLITHVNSDGGYGLDFRLDTKTSNTKATTSRMFLSQSGEVGIGTTDPYYMLHLGGDTVGAVNGQLAFGHVANVPSGLIQGYRVDGSYKGELRFLTSTSGGTVTQRMVIDEDGNVGIGTDSPGAKLDVDGSFKLSDFTSTSVATTGSLSPNQNYQASTQDTLADLTVDPSGNVVRGMQEGTWTFTKAQLDGTLGMTLISAPGVNKAVIVYESSWMIKYNATGAISANQRYEIRQASNTGVGVVTVLPGAKINEILSNGQTMPGGGASAYGFYSRDVPADTGGRTFKTNTATTLHKNVSNQLPTGVETVSIKLKYRIYDATTF